MRGLWETALRRPVMVIGVVLLPALALGWQARHLAFEPGIHLLPASDPMARAEQRRRATFGDDFRLLVAVAKPHAAGGVVGAPSLRALASLHERLEAMPGVRRVSSLVNAPVLVASPGAAMGTPVWAGIGAEAGPTLVQRLSASELEKFMFLSALWEVSPLYLETDRDVPEAELVRDIQLLVLETEATHPEAGKILLVGAGLVETSLASHIFDDLSRLIPYAVGVVALGLLWVAPVGSLLVIAVLHCLVLVAALLGGMAALGMSVNLVSVLAPVILIPVGIADLLHLYVRLRSGVDRISLSDEARPMLHRAFSRLHGAMLGTSATTALAFLGFLVSPVAAIRQFGLTMSAGAVLALILTFTLDAALLVLLWRPPVGTTAARRLCLSRLERVLLGLTSSREALRRRARLALRIVVPIAIAGLLSLAWLRIDDTWIQNFDPDSRVAQDTGLFEKRFLGTNLLSVVVEADPANPGARAAAIDLVHGLGQAFAFRVGILGALSASTLARSLDPAQGKPWEPWPSPSPDRLEAALTAWERHGPVLPRVSMLVSADRSRHQLLLFVQNQPHADLVSVVSAVREWSEERATHGGLTVRLGGDLVANLRMVRLAVLGQAISMGALLVTLTILTLLYLRSVKISLVLLAPMALATLLTCSALVMLRIPYGVAVSMFPTLVIGLAVDFGIHIRAGIVRTRHAPRRRWARDMAVVIRGILLNGALWAVGFAVLTLSGLPPNRNLGALCSFVAILSTAATLVLLPPAMLADMSEESPAATNSGHGTSSRG